MIPKHLLQVDHKKSLQLIISRFATWIFPAVAIALLVNSDFSLPIVLLMSLPLMLVSAIGLHNLGLLGHEGTHFSLHKNRYKSAHIGVFTSSFIPGHLDMGFAISHASHHRFTNTEKDPDIFVFHPLKSFWTRLLLARLKASNEYTKTAFKLAFLQKNPSGINLEPTEIKRLARLNFFGSPAESVGSIVS